MRVRKTLFRSNTASRVKFTAAMYLDLLDRVIDQTQRRVFGGEAVTAAQSISEPAETIIFPSVRLLRDIVQSCSLAPRPQIAILWTRTKLV